MKSENSEAKHKPQRFAWKSVGTFKSFSEADEKRKKLLAGNDAALVKVRRCGPEGRMFKVKVGTSLETKSAKKKSSKTEKSSDKA